MLLLRTAIVFGVIGLSLWGLFSLLSKLKEPALLRSANAVVVKGCEDPSQNAKCDALLCEKSLLDRKLVAPRAFFAVNLERSNATDKVVGGRVMASLNAPPQFFACVLRAHKIIDVNIVSESELTNLGSQF